MARRTDVTWRIGTMGFGYAAWRGVFYPPGMKPQAYLNHFASRFDCVELDTTFHAMPTVERVRAWADQVDDDFRFTVKTPKMITHEGLIDQRIDLMRAFVETIRAFDHKLSMVLMQFAPTVDATHAPRLMRMLDRVSDVPLAVEFRHPSWFEQGVVRLIAERGVTVVANDYQERTQPLVSRQAMYVRFIGEHDRFPKQNVEELDMTDRLAWWVDRIEKTALPGATVHALMNNDYAGYSIATGDRLKGLLGLPTKRTETMASLFD